MMTGQALTHFLGDPLQVAGDRSGSLELTARVLVVLGRQKALASADEIANDCHGRQGDGAGQVHLRQI